PDRAERERSSILCQDARECGEDSDCSQGYLCRCDERGQGICVAASCRGDEDCPQGRCVQTAIRHGLSCAEIEHAYQCTTSQDECIPPLACAPGKPCAFDQQEGRFRCLE